jgi:hypothetical protein
MKAQKPHIRRRADLDYSETRAPRTVWNDTREALWKAQALANLLAEMAWGVEQATSIDEKLEYSYLEPHDLRFVAEMLLDELACAAKDLAELESKAKTSA